MIAKVVGYTEYSVFNTLRLAPLVRVPSDNAPSPPTPLKLICEMGEAAKAAATVRLGIPQFCAKVNELSGME